MIVAQNYIEALTIEERIQALNSACKDVIDFQSYQQWVNRRGVVKESDIVKYYRSKNITPEQIARVVSLKDESEKKILAAYIENIDWFVKYKKIMGFYESTYKKIVFDKREIDLGMFVFPYIVYAGDIIKKRIDEVTTIKISENVLKDILGKITEILLNIGIKTFVWEFRSSTLDDGYEKENDQLKRYLYELRKGENIRKIYDKYPVIARRITIKTKELVENYINLVNRIEKDFNELETIVGNNISELIGIDSNQGDTHEHGQFVVKLLFDRGNVIYKPRNLLIQKCFYEFIEEISRMDKNLLEHKTGNTKYHSSYTWESFIRHDACSNKKQIANYYTRFGQLCAFVYLLRGNDIHYENIIACGEYPIIIDVETLFQNLSDSVQYQNDAASIVYKDCIDSVGGTAMIPIIAFSKSEGGKGIDISALSGKGQILPFKILQLVEQDSSQIHFEEQDVKMDDAYNLPVYKETTIDFHDYITEILSGFNNIMRFVLNNRENVIEKVIEKFNGVKIRHLMKATQNYAKMMNFTSHPNYCQNIVEMERMLLNMLAYPYKNKKIIEFEIMDILGGDIPIFYGKTNSTNIITSSQNEISDYFHETMLEKVKKRIIGLNEEKITKQISQMKVCMGLFVKENHNKYLIEFDNGRLGGGEIWKCIENISDIIYKNAIVDTESMTSDWANVFWDDVNSCWKTRGLSSGLNGGLTGIYAFLYLANKKINKYDRFIEIMHNSLLNGPNDKLPISLADGITFNLYMEILLYKDTFNEKHKQAAYFYIGLIKNNIESCQNLSFLYGLSGIALVIAQAWRLFEDDNIKEFLDKILEIIDDATMEDESFLSGMAGVRFCSKIIESLLNPNLNFDDIKKVKSELIKDIDFSLSTEQMFNKIVKPCDGKMISFSGGLSEQLYKAILKNDIIQSDKICNIIAHNIRKNNWYFPTISGYTTVGFMYGLSGIGFALLKYCDPHAYDIPLGLIF
ncbi:MAG: type 2 lantipeptide synthetase LanM [Lachnospiraceae bacterium]|nr:type 2 lantipeptide synthetase LanM [Lachnospiraceae bacterium]